MVKQPRLRRSDLDAMKWHKSEVQRPVLCPLRGHGGHCPPNGPRVYYWVPVEGCPTHSAVALGSWIQRPGLTCSTHTPQGIGIKRIHNLTDSSTKSNLSFTGSGDKFLTGLLPSNRRFIVHRANQKFIPWCTKWEWLRLTVHYTTNRQSKIWNQ